MNTTLSLIEMLKRHPELWDASICLKRGEILENAGTTPAYLYLVEEGALRITFNDGTSEHTIRFGYPGTVITRLDAFLSGKTSVYTISAVRKSRVRRIRKDTFDAFVNSSTSNLLRWNELLSATISALLERETDLLATMPKERYERVMQRSPQLFQHVPLRYIAAYLRMAPETLSRLRKS